jgi:hypothetical protein
VGHYIQTPGANHGKAAIIAYDHSGEILRDQPRSYAGIPEGKALIVVVDNGAFEAAGFCFNEEEFKAFTLPYDLRPKQYGLIDRAKAEKLSGYKAVA